MIKANELRLNNIVTVDNPEYHPRLKDVPLRVKGMEETIFDGKKDFSIRLEDRNRETYAQLIRFIKPIELTLGILDKCKFDNCSRHYNYDIGEIDAYVKKSGNNVCLSLGIFGHGFGDDIEYLHELQNFYFENTKQELEVQL